MPTLKEERFRAEFRQAYNLFVSRINAYLENPTEAARSCILSELAVKAEYLGFKYWLIMSDPHLRKTFEPAMNWNRTCAEARFASQTENCYTTDREQESPCQPMLRNECCDENCWRNMKERERD